MEKLSSWKKEFLTGAIKCQALRFGAFTLKSGRVSPYFFDMGKFCDGASLSCMASSLVSAIVESNLEFDVVFGPAYKGIPLCAAVTMMFATKTGKNYKYAFNRKEKKDHGECEVIVGAVEDMKRGARVLILDDVITAGTSIRESLDLLHQYNCQPVGVVVCLDRQEVTGDESNAGSLEAPKSMRSAVQQVTESTGLPVVTVVTLDNLIGYLSEGAMGSAKDSTSALQAMQLYRKKYGVE